MTGRISVSLRQRGPALGHAGATGKLVVGGARSGMALAVAIIALAIVSLFVAGSAFFTLQEARTGRNALIERGALEAAEFGATAVLRDWDPSWNLGVPVGATLGSPAFSLADGSTATARTTRTSATTFWVVSEGVAGGPTTDTQARRTVGVFYRLMMAAPTVQAALTVRDSAEVRSGGLVSGADSATGGTALVRPCPGGSRPVAGITAADTTRICDGVCGAAAGNVSGFPRFLTDPLAADTLRYLLFGDRSWRSLTATPDVVLAPNDIVSPAFSSVGGVCQRGLPGNWGDPASASACASYFPVIWARGDVTLSGGAGQGILLAEGDVRLTNGATFVGLVIARDDIVIQSTGGTILGAALAADARSGPGDHSLVERGGLIRYSACALQSALLGGARLQRVRQRAWAEFH